MVKRITKRFMNGPFPFLDNARYYLFNHIIRGDKGDGVPNILSNDDTFVEGFRQTPMSQKKVDGIIEDLEQGELLYAASWYRNYLRNQTLIDFEYIPEDMQLQIVEEFETQKVSSRAKIFNYMITHRLKNLMDVIEDF